MLVKPIKVAIVNTSLDKQYWSYGDHWVDGFRDAGCEADQYRYEQIETLPNFYDLYFFVEVRYNAASIPWYACPRVLYSWDSHIEGLDSIEEAGTYFERVYLASKADTTNALLRGKIRAAWLPEACNPRVHVNLHTEKRFDVGLVGGRDATWIRKGYSRNDFVSFLENTKDYSFFVKTGIYGHDYARAINEATLGFDRPVIFNVGTRIFENSAMGLAHLMAETEYESISGLRELFTPFEHYIPYDDTVEGLDSTIKASLKDKFLLKYITEKAQKHVLENHTYAHRARKVLEDILPGAVYSI